MFPIKNRNPLFLFYSRHASRGRPVGMTMRRLPLLVSALQLCSLAGCAVVRPARTIDPHRLAPHPRPAHSRSPELGRTLRLGLRLGHAPRMQLSAALVDQVKLEVWRLSDAEKGGGMTLTSTGLAAEQMDAVEQV